MPQRALFVCLLLLLLRASLASRGWLRGAGAWRRGVAGPAGRDPTYTRPLIKVLRATVSRCMSSSGLLCCIKSVIVKLEVKLNTLYYTSPYIRWGKKTMGHSGALLSPTHVEVCNNVLRSTRWPTGAVFRIVLSNLSGTGRAVRRV